MSAFDFLSVAREKEVLPRQPCHDAQSDVLFGLLAALEVVGDAETLLDDVTTEVRRVVGVTACVMLLEPVEDGEGNCRGGWTSPFSGEAVGGEDDVGVGMTMGVDAGVELGVILARVLSMLDDEPPLGGEVPPEHSPEVEGLANTAGLGELAS